MLQAIVRALHTAPFEAMLLQSEMARRYATGFPSSAGVCYISEKQAVFLTDFRYIEAAKKQVQGWEVREIASGKTYMDAVQAYLAQDGVQSMALEEDVLSYQEYRRWKKTLKAEVVPMDGLLDRLRMVKTPWEVKQIEQAQRIAEQAFEEVKNFLKPGVSEKRIATELIYQMFLHGAENVSFDPIVVSGVHTSKPHGVPSDKLLSAGDFVTMDFGCIYNGYCSDMTRTVAIGAVREEMRQVYQTVLEAQIAGIATIKAGVEGKAVDAAAREVIEKAGYGKAFGHGFGHGVGLYIHEKPNASPRATERLPAGAVITAEPGIYLPGKFGVRIEDMIVVTEHGHRNLTNTPKTLCIL